MDGDQARLTVWRMLEAAVVLVVLGFFLYATRSILNPILLLFLLWAVLIPFRQTSGHTALLTTAGVLAVVWLLSTTGSLLAPFVLAVVIAYVLDPVVDVLERRRLPRALAIVLLTLPVIGVVAGGLFVAVPAALGQLGDLAEQAPLFFERVADWVGQRLQAVNLPFVDEDAALAKLRAIDSAAVVAFVQERQEALTGWIMTGVLGLGRGVGSLFGIVTYVVLTPVLTFYLLRDWDAITKSFGDLLPHSRRDALVSFARDYDLLLSRYLRGQVTVALAVGAITGLGLLGAGFPYAGTLGLMVAVFSVVPYLGLLLSLVPALFIALVSGSVVKSLITVAVVYTVAQILEGTVISPRIVGESVGLHPVWVVLALALGGFFFGFVGLLIGVPIAAGLKLLIVRGLAAYKASDLYRGTPSGEADGTV
jgi:predicted PurR-regulated permease PerM